MLDGDFRMRCGRELLGASSWLRRLFFLFIGGAMPKEEKQSMPQIAIINESTFKGFTDSDAQGMIPAFGQQWNNDLLPMWHLEPATLHFVPRGQQPAVGSWWVVFLDNSDQAQALAYHDLTNEGLPISKVFVQTILEDKSSISVGATHEICEMAVDPWLNGAFQDPKGVFWAAEICDPVEDDQYGYEIGGVLVTDFVSPGWFAHKNAQGPIDLKGHAGSAFQILSGGYAQKFEAQSGWQQVNGSAIRASRKAAPNGSRRERRSRLQSKWNLSAVRWDK